MYVCISRRRQAAQYRSQRETKATKIKDFLIGTQLFKRKQWFPCFYFSYPNHNSMKTPQKINKQKIAVVPFLPLKSVFHIILGLHHLQKLQIPKIWSKYCIFHRAEWYHLWQTKVKTKLWKGGLWLGRRATFACLDMKTETPFSNTLLLSQVCFSV